MTASQQTPTQRGALIVVEGLDRAGKSSQCEMLQDYLSRNGHNVKYIRFPGIDSHVLVFQSLRHDPNPDSRQDHPHRKAHR